MELTDIPAAAETGLRLDLHPTSIHSRVYAAGQDISKFVQGVTVRADVAGLTQVELRCIAVHSGAAAVATVEGMLFPLESTPARCLPLLRRLEAFATHTPICASVEWSEDWPCDCGYAALQEELRTLLK